MTTVKCASRDHAAAHLLTASDVVDKIGMIAVHKTTEYVAWYKGIKDTRTKKRIDTRLLLLSQGDAGDHKAICKGLWELRFHFGAGIRIYYTVRGKEVILLLAGGDKRTQQRDIDRAKALMEAYNE